MWTPRRGEFANKSGSSTAALPSLMTQAGSKFEGGQSTPRGGRLRGKKQSRARVPPAHSALGGLVGSAGGRAAARFSTEHTV